MVERLPFNALASVPKISALACGAVEEFRHEIGFTQEETRPNTTTVALHCAVKKNASHAFTFIVGGEDLDVQFPMSAFLGLEGKNAGKADTIISLKQDTAGIKFRKNSHVTSWEKIQEAHRSSISSPGALIDWEMGPQCYVRWKFRANNASNKPGAVGRLILESMILPADQSMDSLPLATKQELKRGRAGTILLWETSVELYKPDSVLGWATTPGLQVMDSR